MHACSRVYLTAVSIKFAHPNSASVYFDQKIEPFVYVTVEVICKAE